LNDVVIVSAVRLPIGRFGGSLREVSDWDLGTIVIAEVLKRAGLKGDEIDEVIMAHGFRTGDLPERFQPVRPLDPVEGIFINY
jgi:acetyl-CoA C-acetyltransferase